MEANKDAAIHYIELAEKAILANDHERALRYLNKSESLFPTQKAKGKRRRTNLVERRIDFRSDLIERLMHTNSYSSSSKHQPKSEDQPSASPTSNGASSTTRQRSHANSSSTNSQPSPSSDYTPEEVEAVRK